MREFVINKNNLFKAINKSKHDFYFWVWIPESNIVEKITYKQISDTIVIAFHYSDHDECFGQCSFDGVKIHTDKKTRLRFIEVKMINFFENIESLKEQIEKIGENSNTDVQKDYLKMIYLILCDHLFFFMAQ